ncbi:hypothetical protein GQ607_017586 [Colletotrichum asianum]|uniref:C2H2-type domain-containing protein n=1 Tax=Colletotrichum asianum TaxID=702518 RepID=A0A8H3ZDL4_9PEZI|nr:hypothetical protein GQ607_017586 [Colletotrichum asianum]
MAELIILLHRHDTENDYENTLSERISSLRIEDGHGGGGGGGGGRFQNEIQEPNPQQPTVDDAADAICAGARAHPNDSSIEPFSDSINTTTPETTAQKSEKGLLDIPVVPQDSEVIHSSSKDLQVDLDPSPTPQLDVSINIRDTLVEPKKILLERSKSFREPEDIEQGKTRLLACPYPKYAPEIYGHRCRAAAFSQIHRLKEHLYRVHEQPPHCVRCGETFSNKSDVKAHLGRPDEICDFAADVSVDGLSFEQMKKLRSKKRKPGVATNEEKWRDIFGIVFPDATDFPDPYYSSFDNRSNDRGLLSMGQSDIESIFSDVPPESEDRMFTNLEQICGPLERPKRQKVWNTIHHFFMERVQQMVGSKTVSQNNRDAVHLHGSSPASVSLKTIAPEAEERFAEAQLSLTQSHAKGPSQPVLEAKPAMGNVQHLQTNSLEDHLDRHLFDLPSENIFTEVLPENMKIVSMDIVNECTNTERRVSIPSGGIMGDPFTLNTLVPYEDWGSLFQADDESLDFNSILNDWEERIVDYAPADWPTGRANL